MSLHPCGRVVESQEYQGVAMLMGNATRARSLIVEAVKGLDLTGLTVLTEAATREYAVTSIIAAAAGARVYALAKTTEWSPAKDAEITVEKFADMCGVRERVEVIFDKRLMAVEQADIITNLGCLRPIDKNMIEMMKTGAVILCMHEKWEAREDDIDLVACGSAKIPVVYTDEGELFKYCGALCAKMLFEVGVEIHRNRIVIIGEGNFADVAAIYLKSLDAEITMSTSNWMAETKGCDAIVVADLHGEYVVSDDFGVPVVNLANNGRMGKTLAHLGVKPVIEIHTLGFKTAAEFLVNRRTSGEKKRSKPNKRD